MNGTQRHTKSLRGATIHVVLSFRTNVRNLKISEPVPSETRNLLRLLQMTDNMEMR